MVNPLDIDDPSIGRFDRSFLVHMIKDFFVILLLVTVLEFAFKAGLVYYNFTVNGEEKVQHAAEEIADNVRSIMRNEGGPVAARTLYPILRNNWKDLGYSIAITPSPVTVQSIQEIFDFKPTGIPTNNWSDETHNAASLEIKAEESCLTCHTGAKIGDVLGKVDTRKYLSSDFAVWWQGVQLASGLALAKIVFHSILLFILLRSRLEPLLRLRSVVSNLARAFGGLDHRVEIRSSDEFGALAKDLNLFLDRVSHLIGQLGDVLRRVVAVNVDILSIQSDLYKRAEDMAKSTRSMERRAMISAKREPLLSEEWFAIAKSSVADFERRLEKTETTSEVGELVETLRLVVSQAEEQIKTSESLFSDLVDLGQHTDGFQQAVAEMARLEERMKGIIDSGTLLVRRLQPQADT